ncbi:MAG: DUF169 domain-containing protein [Peptococcaceae bacterium]|jgi:uncharacterized protein (DUF169 family)|nr:DUF169 domain-containing protein [Peptococcaceae bacterium]
MESKMADVIRFKYGPVAILPMEEKPEGALQFKEGRFGCVTAAFMAAAKRRRPAVFDRRTFGCPGGGVGLGFGDQYVGFPGGIECYISVGNPEFARSPEAQNIRFPTPLDEGEGYFRSSETARNFVDSLPMTDIPAQYVGFMPLELLTPAESPAVIVFLANTDQLAALSCLAHYDRGGDTAVISPFAAGCQSLFLLPYAEAEKDPPRAVIGLTDISARKHVDRDLLSFAVPYRMFRDMEASVEGSFLARDFWLRIRERNKE